MGVGNQFCDPLPCCSFGRCCLLLKVCAVVPGAHSPHPQDLLPLAHITTSHHGSSCSTQSPWNKAASTAQVLCWGEDGCRVCEVACVSLTLPPASDGCGFSFVLKYRCRNYMMEGNYDCRVGKISRAGSHTWLFFWSKGETAKNLPFSGYPLCAAAFPKSALLPALWDYLFPVMRGANCYKPLGKFLLCSLCLRILIVKQ